MGEEHGPAAASGRIGIVQMKPPREGERGGFTFVTEEILNISVSGISDIQMFRYSAGNSFAAFKPPGKQLFDQLAVFTSFALLQKSDFHIPVGFFANISGRLLVVRVAALSGRAATPL